MQVTCQGALTLSTSRPTSTRCWWPGCHPARPRLLLTRMWTWGQFHQKLYMQHLYTHILYCSTSISPTISMRKLQQLVWYFCVQNFCDLGSMPYAKKQSISTGIQAVSKILVKLSPGWHFLQLKCELPMDKHQPNPTFFLQCTFKQKVWSRDISTIKKLWRKNIISRIE